MNFNILAKQITQLEYYKTTVDSFGEWEEDSSSTSEAAGTFW